MSETQNYLNAGVQGIANSFASPYETFDFFYGGESKKELQNLSDSISWEQIEDKLLLLLDGIEFSQSKNVNDTISYFKSTLGDIIPQKNVIDEIFNKSKKGKKFFDNALKYGDVDSIKLNTYINNAANNFDVPSKYIIAILVGESDPKFTGNPFRVNKKGAGQFLAPTFKGLYPNGNVVGYFKYKGEKEYADKLSGLTINSLNDRYDPEKSINAIAAHLRYIKTIKPNLPWEYVVAMYNVGHNGLVDNFFENNNQIRIKFVKLYGNQKKTFKRALHASSYYYMEGIGEKTFDI